MEHIRPELGYGPDAECELVSDSECVIGYKLSVLSHFPDSWFDPKKP